jgi:hypothetical protein
LEFERVFAQDSTPFFVGLSLAVMLVLEAFVCILFSTSDIDVSKDRKVRKVRRTRAHAARCARAECPVPAALQAGYSTLGVSDSGSKLA